MYTPPPGQSPPPPSRHPHWVDNPQTPHWADTPIGQTPPLADTPLGRHPLGKHPPGRHPYPPPQTTTAADSTHPIGMHSCLHIFLLERKVNHAKYLHF